MIDLERFNRYQEKRGFIFQRLDFIVEWSQEDIDLKTRFAIYKVGQEAIEGTIDLVAMINRDQQNVIVDDYGNIDNLAKLEILSEDQCKLLKQANGLRNRLVHDYNGIDDDLALTSLLTIYPKLKDIVGELMKWVKQRYKQ